MKILGLKSQALIWGTALTLSILSYQNCSPAKFAALPPAVQAVGQSCSQVLLTTAQNLRIIFMVDNSDSTAPDKKTGKGGTDPTKYYRDTVISNFIQSYSSHTNLNYSFGMFNKYGFAWDAGLPYDPMANNNNFLQWTPSSGFTPSIQKPFGVAQDLQNALAAFLPLTTLGSTKYLDGMGAAQNLIDLAAQPNDGWNYVVVFMSDGMPTDWGNVLTDQQTGIKTMMDNFSADLASKGAQATVSTVYFGPSGATGPISNLQFMATLGGGQFVDTNQTQNFNIQDLITVPGTSCTH